MRRFLQRLKGLVPKSFHALEIFSAVPTSGEFRSQHRNISDGGDYLDELAGAKSQLRLWRSVAAWTSAACLPLALLVIGLAVWNVKNADRTQVILSPAVQRFEIATPGQVTDSYIRAAFEHVAERNSSWTFETMEENYQDLFQHYYANDLATRTRTNLSESGRFEQVKQNKMVSTYKIDHDRSEYTWCAALNLACGIVTGRQTLFIDGNQPYRADESSYLIFSETIYPTKTNPFSLRITRLVIGDYEPLKKALEAAKKGELPNDIASKTFQ
jgi:hypothetical protein